MLLVPFGIVDVGPFLRGLSFEKKDHVEMLGEGKKNNVNERGIIELQWGGGKEVLDRATDMRDQAMKI